MTDTLKGLVVSLNHDIREDDAEDIIQAIRMVKGVANVAPLVSEAGDWVVAERSRREMRERVEKALMHPITNGG